MSLPGVRPPTVPRPRHVHSHRRNAYTAHSSQDIVSSLSDTSSAVDLLIEQDADDTTLSRASYETTDQGTMSEESPSESALRNQSIDVPSHSQGMIMPDTCKGTANDYQSADHHTLTSLPGSTSARLNENQSSPSDYEGTIDSDWEVMSQAVVESSLATSQDSPLQNLQDVQESTRDMRDPKTCGSAVANRRTITNDILATRQEKAARVKELCEHFEAIGNICGGSRAQEQTCKIVKRDANSVDGITNEPETIVFQPVGKTNQDKVEMPKDSEFQETECDTRLQRARKSLDQVTSALQGSQYVVVSLLDDRASSSEMPLEVPVDISAVIFACMLSRIMVVRRHLQRISSVGCPTIILCVDEGAAFEPEDIYYAHRMFLEWGASDTVIHWRTNKDLLLELDMKVASASKVHASRTNDGEMNENEADGSGTSLFWPLDSIVSGLSMTLSFFNFF